MSKGAAAERPEELDRRKTILRAAVDVFAKKGYHGCRISDVAKEAGVAYGLVYHYFKNKEELLASVFETAWGGFVDRVRDAAEGKKPLETKVRRICEVAFEAYHVDPRGVRVLILEIARSPTGTQVHRNFAFSEVIKLAVEMFEQARAAGELRPDLEPKLCAAMLFGAVEMALTSLVAGFMSADDATTLGKAQAQLADTFLRGVLNPDALEKRGVG